MTGHELKRSKATGQQTAIIPSIRAFTIVELMIVVAILGVLAVIAIPTFTAYFRNAKTAEVTDSLNKIRKGAKHYFERELVDHKGNRVRCQFPEGSPTCTPDSNKHGKKSKSIAATRLQEQTRNGNGFAQFRVRRLFGSGGCIRQAGGS